jgi:hypothetical protein
MFESNFPVRLAISTPPSFSTWYHLGRKDVVHLLSDIYRSDLYMYPAGGQGLRELSCPVELLQADRRSQSEKGAKLAMKSGQLQPFLAASLLCSEGHSHPAQ